MPYHCIERARGRYGIDLTPREVEGLEYAIRVGLPIVAPIWSELGADAGLYAIRYRGQWLAAIVKGGHIATFKPRRALASRKAYLKRWKDRNLVGEWRSAR